MVTLHLAIKNLLGAGLRTWLNVIVLSIAFVTIIGSQGLYNGMNRQALQAMQAMQTGGGQFWHPQYDPYDPLTLDKAHGYLPEPLKSAVNRGSAAAVLLAPATIYPQGRIQPILLKGINPDQQVVNIPTQKLQSTGEERPAVIGTRMAESAKLNKGDFITVRWRDDQGTFDAADFKIVEIMETRVAEVDKGQLWISRSDLQAMLGVENEATLVIMHPDADKIGSAGDWVWRSVSHLTQDLTKMVQSKTASAAIFYTLLLLMCCWRYSTHRCCRSGAGVKRWVP
jgi:ABC-type lipoprotein release transport system permease subunit